MSGKGYRTVEFQRCAAQVFEWDPAEHGGQHEPWSDLEATMDAQWPGWLEARGVQLTMDPPVTERVHDRATDRRRVVRRAVVLPLEVPADLACRCRESVLNGYLTYDPSEAER